MTLSQHSTPSSKDLETFAYRICEVAEQLNVSDATIRNWLKLGHLSGPTTNTVYAKSLDHLKENLIGKSKLTGRANKSHFDDHDHEQHTTEILLSLQDDIDKIGSRYESGLSSSHRNKEGIYYTPEHVCQAMLSKLPSPSRIATFCDPCCGSGNFLIAALKAGFLPENIYGYDTDPVAIEIAQRRFENMVGSRSENIKIRNGLLEDSSFGYDVIATNPPWGKKMSKAEKDDIALMLGLKKAEDTSSLFLTWAMRKVKVGGYISYLMPDSFFNIASFESARARSLSLTICTIEDFGKAFKGLLVGAVAITLKKSDAELQSGKVLVVSPKGETFSREQLDFKKNPKSIINYNSTPDSAKVLASIMKKNHITLKGWAKWGLGIVTGDNKHHCRTDPNEGDVPVYKGSDITKRGLKNPSIFISDDLSQYQQVAKREMYYAPEKIIYKFISSKIVCFHDTEQRLVLNSANIFIPNEEFPISMKVIADYLTSDFMNWVFSEIFRTHKVLRGDLEQLPIYHEPLSKMEDFDEDIVLDFVGVQRGEHGAFRIKG